MDEFKKDLKRTFADADLILTGGRNKPGPLLAEVRDWVEKRVAALVTEKVAQAFEDGQRSAIEANVDGGADLCAALDKANDRYDSLVQFHLDVLRQALAE